MTSDANAYVKTEQTTHANKRQHICTSNNHHKTAFCNKNKSLNASPMQAKRVAIEHVLVHVHVPDLSMLLSLLMPPSLSSSSNDFSSDLVLMASHNASLRCCSRSNACNSTVSRAPLWMHGRLVERHLFLLIIANFTIPRTTCTCTMVLVGCLDFLLC